MSQPTMTNKKGGKQGAKQAGKEAGNQTAKTNSGKTRQLAEAALSISGEVGGPFLGGHDLIPLESEVKLFIVRSTMPDADPWIGFKIDIPLVAGTDESGFGALYQPNSDPQIIEQPVLSTGHMITVKLPRGKYTTVISSLTEGNEDLPEALRSANRLFRVQFDLESGAEVDVVGFAVPFAVKEPYNGWLRSNLPMVGDLTLLKLLTSRRFVFIAKTKTGSLVNQLDETRLPSEFKFGDFFGTEHHWDLERYRQQIPANTGEQFSSSLVYSSDNDMLVALTQAQVQDTFFYDLAAEKIRSMPLPAYFVRQDDQDQSKICFAVIQRQKAFIDQHASSWQHLADGGYLDLLFHKDFEVAEANQAQPDEDYMPKRFKARIMTLPKNIEGLADHVPNSKEYMTDLVLKVRLDSLDDMESLVFHKERGYAQSCYENCVSLDFASGEKETKRKVEAICTLAPGVPPRFPIEGEAAVDVCFKQHLQRDLFCGRGFYNTLVKFGIPADVSFSDSMPGAKVIESTSELASPTPVTARSLPIVNYLSDVDPALADAIVAEAVPEDQVRFRAYMSNRFLGIGLIAAPGGTGKTTILAAMTLAMVFNPKIAKVYGSGPTHVAVSNFAERLYHRGGAIVDRFNSGKGSEDKTRAHRPLVVRGHKVQHELWAFQNILQYGVADNSAAPNAKSTWFPPSRWTYPLSPANWLLVMMGSKAAKASLAPGAIKVLHPDDQPWMLEQAASYNAGKAFPRLCQLVRGEISWLDYTQGMMATDADITNLLGDIILKAELVLTTPATSNGSFYVDAKTSAKGVAIDEAACMNRADLPDVWGNTLRPLVMAGDVKQLTPAMLETRNRFYSDGRISALGFMQAAGMPVYRLWIQHRMCRGMFDLAKKFVYTDLPHFKYGEASRIDAAEHRMGRDFEDWMINIRKFPGLEPSKPADTIQPVWVHTPDTIVHRVGTSKRSPEQVNITLQLLSEFVKAKKAEPAKIVIICPYKANVEFANRRLKHFPALEGMPPVQTADSFQGREGDMAVVIFGTNKMSGARFTSNVNRLNVMITRQRSCLVLVGDMDVTGPLSGAGADKADKEATKSSRSYDQGGVSYFRPRMLRGILKELWTAKRFITVAKNKDEATPEPTREELDELAGEEARGEDEEEKGEGEISYKVTKKAEENEIQGYEIDEKEEPGKGEEEELEEGEGQKENKKEKEEEHEFLDRPRKRRRME